MEIDMFIGVIFISLLVCSFIFCYIINKKMKESNEYETEFDIEPTYDNQFVPINDSLARAANERMSVESDTDNLEESEMYDHDDNDDVFVETVEELVDCLDDIIENREDKSMEIEMAIDESNEFMEDDEEEMEPDSNRSLGEAIKNYIEEIEENDDNEEEEL